MARPFERVLITGGAGFIGSHLALSLRNRFPESRIMVLDNLMRSGSELNVPRLQKAGVHFLRGDIRLPADIQRVEPFDLLIDCAAEPSVQAGMDGSPRNVLDINLSGSLNCFEAARRYEAGILFLSTSRIFPCESINSLPFEETVSRIDLPSDFSTTGISEHGIAEDFPLDGPRTFYGFTKLACELALKEYHEFYDLPVLINRCGLVAGPWQWGKVDQGVITLWASHHVFNRPLRYCGFGGKGHQVRDVLHINDLAQLIITQLEQPNLWDGRIYNVGGGRDNATSLLELTGICAELTGQQLAIGSKPETAASDIAWYITDTRRVQQECGWMPQASVSDTVRDIVEWIQTNPDKYGAILE